MAVRFPHANKFEIEDAAFRQAWAELLRKHDRNSQGPNLPRLTSRKSKRELEENSYQLSLEYLLRKIVPAVSQNTAQATRPFLDANRHILESTPERGVNPATGRLVQGVRLLPGAFRK